jgi:hypothetical protein
MLFTTQRTLTATRTWHVANGPRVCDTAWANSGHYQEATVGTSCADLGDPAMLTQSIRDRTHEMPPSQEWNISLSSKLGGRNAVDCAVA